MHCDTYTIKIITNGYLLIHKSKYSLDFTEWYCKTSDELFNELAKRLEVNWKSESGMIPITTVG